MSTNYHNITCLHVECDFSTMSWSRGLQYLYYCMDWLLAVSKQCQSMYWRKHNHKCKETQLLVRFSWQATIFFQIRPKKHNLWFFYAIYQKKRRSPKLSIISTLGNSGSDKLIYRTIKIKQSNVLKVPQSHSVNTFPELILQTAASGH